MVNILFYFMVIQISDFMVILLRPKIWTKTLIGQIYQHGFGVGC